MSRLAAIPSDSGLAGKTEDGSHDFSSFLLASALGLPRQVSPPNVGHTWGEFAENSRSNETLCRRQWETWPR